MNTKENNKLLAEFLGWKEQTDPTERWLGAFRTQEGIVHRNTSTEPLLFHYDWNWLMLVVDKIEDLGYTVETKINWCRIKENGETISLRWETDATKIEAVYNACIEFVKWRKEQNNK